MHTFGKQTEKENNIQVTPPPANCATEAAFIASAVSFIGT